MANKNYNRGVRFERELVKVLKGAGCQVTRSAGSHGRWDVCAVATEMTVANLVNHLFDWTPTTPKDEWFDCLCRYDTGRLERVCYIKVIRDCDQWVYLIQCKVSA